MPIRQVLVKVVDSRRRAAHEGVESRRHLRHCGTRVELHSAIGIEGGLVVDLARQPQRRSDYPPIFLVIEVVVPDARALRGVR